jgi:dienelactone hydrolase
MTQTETTRRDVNTPHQFAPPATREAWEARVRRLREQILCATGLWPMPEKGALEPKVTGRIEGPDYTIENVALRTLPGFYLCGNLYRPKGKQGPYPAIVNPHGHWKNGRLEMEEDVPPAAPAPAPPAPGRGNLVAIGVQLARMGFVTFAYDMVGYNDTRPLPHTFANDLRPWLHGISLLGLQLWNSIRVVDYLASLPDVDASRIGATGASGGGTQTFLLCGVDDRIRAAVPVNMISATMQGGCLCENAPGLRLGTDNVEIGAMMAPKPLLLVACTGDWTKNNPSAEWPAIRKVYDLYGAGDKTAVVQFNYEHNYNRESREAMYAWFGRWLQKDPNAERARERPFQVSAEALRVWTDAHPLPTDALPESEFIQSRTKAEESMLEGLWPTDAAGWKRFRETAAPALAHALGMPLPERRTAKAKIEARAKQALVVALASDGEAETRMRAALRERGYEVASLTLTPVEMTREQLWADFFSCYNRTPVGDRMQAITGTLASLEAKGHDPIDVVGLGGAGLWTLLARWLWPGRGRLAVDTGGFDPGDDTAYLPALYAPGLRRAGDLRAAALLTAPNPLCLYNVIAFHRVLNGYRALNAPMRLEAKPLSETEIAEWLSGK